MSNPPPCPPCDRIMVDGKQYRADKVNDHQWMVKRFHSEAESDYVEQLLAVTTEDPIEAIKAAISNDSWA